MINNRDAKLTNTDYQELYEGITVRADRLQAALDAAEAQISAYRMTAADDQKDITLLAMARDEQRARALVEMLHLIEPTHSERFLALMSKHYPAWREARAELNELPLGAATWNE